MVSWFQMLESAAYICYISVSSSAEFSEVKVICVQINRYWCAPVYCLLLASNIRAFLAHGPCLLCLNSTQKSSRSVYIGI